MEILNERLGTVGAFQTRLESTQSTLMTSLENLQASESIISDADMAAATVELARDQILRQMAMATLAQANDLPAKAVSVLIG